MYMYLILNCCRIDSKSIFKFAQATLDAIILIVLFLEIEQNVNDSSEFFHAIPVNGDESICHFVFFFQIHLQYIFGKKMWIFYSGKKERVEIVVIQWIWDGFFFRQPCSMYWVLFFLAVVRLLMVCWWNLRVI